MYVSLGQLKINSELAKEEDKNDVYDKYIVELSNFTIKTLKQYSYKEIINDGDGEKIIEPSSFNIEIENYIYRKPHLEHKNQTDFSPLNINIRMNDTKFSLSENLSNYWNINILMYENFYFVQCYIFLFILILIHIPLLSYFIFFDLK